METQKKESYVQPALVAHELLRDITAVTSGVVVVPNGED